MRTRADVGGCSRSSTPWAWASTPELMSGPVAHSGRHHSPHIPAGPAPLPAPFSAHPCRPGSPAGAVCVHCTEVISPDSRFRLGAVTTNGLSFRRPDREPDSRPLLVDFERAREELPNTFTKERKHAWHVSSLR